MENKARLINIEEDFNLAVSEAAKLYREGGVFVYPTDTISGFGCDPVNDIATERIVKIKGREEQKRFILLISGLGALLRYADIQYDKQMDFLYKIWPNPVSVVLKLNNEAVRLLNTPTAAFRVPNHRFCRTLLEEISAPLVSTSVNRSGKPPLHEMEEINYEFGSEVDAVFYTSNKTFVQASTLIDLIDSEPVLIREGAVKFAELMSTFNA